MRVLHLVIAAAAIPLLSGCSDLYTDYGESRGVSGRNSLNGFGAFRSAFEHAGYRSRDVSRLSDRVRRTDVIVWTPKTLGSVDDSVTRWFDRWLRQGGRTLIYIVPDSGSEADYWMDASEMAAPDQRLEYRKRAARCINQRIQWRLNRSEVQSNGWFKIEPLQSRRVLSKLEGPWQEELPLLDETNSEFIGDSTAVELVMRPFESDETKNASSSAPAANAVPNGNPTGPAGASLWSMPVTPHPTKTPVEYVPLISIDGESSVIGEVRSSQWKNSKILVVAGGSLLTNYAFSREANRRLADKIIAESTPATQSEPLAGFLTSDWGSVSVSDREPNAPQASGMEMLTEWPISIVTMHGVILGMVVCLILLPIFGRPRKIHRTEANDFGHHLDAVAALMNRVGGESYARGRISDYMKRMHGETSGPWVIPDRVSPSDSGSLPREPEKPLTSRDASSDSEPSNSQHGGRIGDQVSPEESERDSTESLTSDQPRTSGIPNQDEANR